MTTFLEDESSAEDSQPLEYYTISLPDKIWYHCSGTRDTLIGGVLYTAIPIARTNIGVSANGNSKELTLTLPITHEFVGRYINYGVPPRRVTVVVRRYQRTSGESEQIWTGIVTSVATEGRIAKLQIPSRASQVFLRVVPNVSVGKLCPHMLYDTMCQVDRAAFKVSTTVISVSGRDVRYDQGSTAQDGWALNGELVHVATGMRMAIRDMHYVNPPFSSVVQISIQMQIPGMQVGDAIEVYAGCDHTINGSQGCTPKFDNRQRFGGFPQLPSKNPFIPTGYGLREDT